jgi:hypothetical protein
MRAAVLASIFSFAALASSALACSATTSRSQFTGGGDTGNLSGSGPGDGSTSNGTGASQSGPAGSGAGGSSGIGGGFTTSVGAGTGGGTSDCTAAAELVYVFGDDNNIYSFDPPNKTFTKIATPDCAASGTPNSMAIDRNLVAWLNYIGAIYTFDLKTKTGCVQAVTLPDQYAQIGMGFSSDTAGGTSETLYIDGIGGAGLAKVVSSNVEAIGDFSNDSNLEGESCELTGTGDAKLYGYFTTSPWVRVAELDKTTANEITDHELTGVGPPSDWAFSFWGGDFYLYAAPGSNSTGNSSVIHYTPSTQAVDTTYVADVGFQIIGAGVSTCAPLTPPQ